MELGFELTHSRTAEMRGARKLKRAAAAILGRLGRSSEEGRKRRAM